MVTYEQICESWETYHAAPCLASWQALWLLVRDCVGPIITNALKHDAPIDRDDIDDATDDATCAIMERLKVVHYIDAPWIASRIHWQKAAVVTAYRRHKQRASLECQIDHTVIGVDILNRPIDDF